MASYTISPIWGAGAQLFDNSGNVLTGGKIYTYLAGTTTPATTYTTPIGAVANSNPIIANSAGRLTNEIWFPVSGAYKFVLKDANDVLLATYDNIPTTPQPPIVNDASSVAYEPGYEVTAGGFTVGATYLITSVGTTDFVAIGAAANVTGIHFTATGVGSGTGTAEYTRYVQDKLRETVSVKDFGAVGDGVTNDTAAIKAALASGAGEVYFPSGTYMCDPIAFGESGVPNLGAIRLVGAVAALADSFLEDPTKTTRIKARTASSVFWKLNYSHNLVVENIAFDGAFISDWVFQLQQGCTKHEYYKCSFEGATPGSGRILVLGDSVINLQVDFNVFHNCTISQGYDIDSGDYADSAIYLVKTNTINNKFYNCSIFKAANLVRIQGASQALFDGCDFEYFSYCAFLVVGNSHFNMRNCYTENDAGTKFLDLVDILYNEYANPIVIESNAINQTVGVEFEATPNIPMVFRNNRMGKGVVVSAPTDTTKWHQVILENNQFITDGIIGAGQTKYCYKRANTLNGVAIPDEDGYWQEFFSFNITAPGTVPGASTTSITVPGAAVGDRIAFFPDFVVPETHIIQAYASATDTVAFTAFQITGAPAAIGNHTYKVVLYKGPHN